MTKLPVFTFLVLVSISGFTANITEAQKKPQKGKPLFESKVITSQTPNHSVKINVEIAGSKSLYLVVTDGGNGYSCDWCDWVEPTLVGPKGTLKLTDLKWKTAHAAWGQVRIGKNAGGGSLVVNKKPVSFGIGTHANSLIQYEVPEGYTRFQAIGGLDEGGVSQQSGSATSVKFLVFNTVPPGRYLKPSGGGSNDSGLRDPADALSGLDVHEDLEVELFAAEPMMLSPTNIDIDHLGRVWVCEVVNYRHRRNERSEGDAIIILEDTDGDSKADKKTVFHQGHDIDSAHGVCVLGNRVIVSVGENVFLFTDTDGDLKADKKTTLFTGISGAQHDHGIHSFMFGPDGKLYFNFGNNGRQIQTPDRKPITDLAGNVIEASRKPYQEGMVFRCNPDGSEMETLGWNFRNNWEVAVDSFGNLWQSDNDDDGNRGVRINFVMEFGNYGYKDELTGAGWRTPRTGMHDEIPKRHWHLNDPGVMPNLLQTGAGSPTGICVYEGTLLPKVFHNQVLHCDAGPNIVRAYPRKVDGAGYSAEILNILEGARDKWFRPSDVCVAPDGSLIIADWYDPGVGGHRMGDATRGRLFRVAPPKTPYKVPKQDFSTIEGAITALKSPNLATRYLAWESLNKKQKEAESALLQLSKSSLPYEQARAFWLLGNITGREQKTVDEAISSGNPQIRILGLRLARRKKLDVGAVIKKLIDDESAAVRRECLVAMSELDTKEMVPLWVKLAEKHDGKDRWYLEALGIAARDRWDESLLAFLTKRQFQKESEFPSKSVRDIVWRSRAEATPELLAVLLTGPETPEEEIPRYLRAFDFQANSDRKQEALVNIAFGASKIPEARQKLISQEALNRLKGYVPKTEEQKAALNKVLEGSKGTSQFVRLVEQFRLEDQYEDLLSLAQSHSTEQLGLDSMNALLSLNQTNLIQKSIQEQKPEQAEKTIQALGLTQNGKIMQILWPLVQNKSPRSHVRRASVRAVAKIKPGAERLLKRVEDGKLDVTLKDAAGIALLTVPWNDLKKRAEKQFPLPKGKDDTPVPPLAELLKMKGDITKGRLVFNTTGTCSKCHIVNNLGREIGPNLSEIGKKLSRQAMFESVLFPSAGISHNYETYTVLLDTGIVMDGLKVSETDDSITIRDKEAIQRTFQKSQIEELKKQEISLMPADLQKVMSTQDLVDVVEYLMTLKKAAPSTEKPKQK